MTIENNDGVASRLEVEQVIENYAITDKERESQELLGSLVQANQYVGEVYSLGYETALVQIHDFHRREVGGIPGLSFLIATRLRLNETFDHSKEDSSIILLRVMDAAPLPNDSEAIRVRVQAAQQVPGPSEEHWDSSTVMDFNTADLLSYAGVRCRVIGTFYLDPSEAGEDKQLRLRFGADLSNYYPNQGLKVYKPNSREMVRKNWTVFPAFLSVALCRVMPPWATVFVCRIRRRGFYCQGPCAGAVRWSNAGSRRFPSWPQSLSRTRADRLLPV